LAGPLDRSSAFPVGRGVPPRPALEAAPPRANTYLALQRVWQEGCAAVADPTSCRADALLAVLQYKLAGNRFSPDRGGPGEAFAEALSGTWWPGGLAVPDGDVPNRVPLSAPLDPEVPLSEAEATALTTIGREYEPFEPRPPHAVWQAPVDSGHGLIQGLAQFVAGADIQRLDSFLWQQDAPTTEVEGACAVTTVDLAEQRQEIRIDCPAAKGLGLQGYVQLKDDAVLGGALGRLQIDGHALTNLRVSGGSFDGTGGQGRLVLDLEERAFGLHARLPDGNAIRSLTLDWDQAAGRAAAVVADDFQIVRDAVAAMREQGSDALSAAPLRRAAVMPALFASLGAPPITWCCLEDTAMPAAALEP
jgi:hypothetical protein